MMESIFDKGSNSFVFFIVPQRLTLVITRITVVCILVWIQPFEEAIHSAGINATSYEPPWFFSYRKTKKKIFLNNPITKNQKPKN